MTRLVGAIQYLRHTRWLRFVVLSVTDGLLWLIAVIVATLARLGFDPAVVDWRGVWLTTAMAAGIFFITGIAVGRYSGRHRLASFEESGGIVVSAFATTATVFAVVWSSPGPNLVPLSAVLAAGAYLSIGAFGARYILRLVLEKSSPRRIGTERMLVFGAGDAGYQAAKALLHDATSDLTPVAFLDDDPSKRSLRLLGLRVVGGRTQIASAAAEYQATSLLIAIPAAPHEELVKIADAGIDAGLSVKILPSLSEIAIEGIRVKNIREIQLADFLDREETRLDLKAIGGYVTGKRILVTGAGGSIGTQLCQTLMRFSPSTILALDHAENNLHRLGLSAASESSQTPLHLILGDVRDAENMLSLFEEYRPDVVFHAAAHKHVPFLEEFPEEATKTNVFGTLNVLQAAHKSQVDTFVNISTDKAADPINALGVTKRTAELLTSYYSTLADGTYLSVRFGNVLGSDGSVIPTFREQLRQNRPLTITHPDATRYFMTIAEAVELVIQAGSMGTENDLFVLDMGEPVRILDLARRLSAALRPGMPLQIQEVGLRQGEKLHEVLFHDSDDSVEKPHDRIWRCRVEPLNPAALGQEISPLGLAKLIAQTDSNTAISNEVKS